MKRLNPDTGKPFVHGDVRADGFLFMCYQKNRIKKDGFFVESWVKPHVITEHKKRNKNWHNINKEKANANSKFWCKKNQDKRRAITKAYRLRNKEKLAEYNKRWDKDNPDKVLAKTAKRRAIKLNATPSWLTKEHYIQIESVYAQAKQLTEQTGIPHEVDHIVPLINKLVCGLHVPWNLEVKTAEANRKKGNSFKIHE